MIQDCNSIKPYDTFVFIGHFCIPTDKATLRSISSLFSGFSMETVAQSVYINRNILLASVLIAFMVSYFFSFFLQHCTWLVVILSIFGIFSLGIFLSIMSWKKYRSILEDVGKSASEGDNNTRSSANFYKWISIGLWTTLSLSLCAIVCLFGKIKVAVKVIQAAAEFVSDYKGIVFTPVVLIVITFSFFVLWMYGLAAIFSTGEIYHNSSYPWGKIKYNDELKYTSD